MTGQCITLTEQVRAKDDKAHTEMIKNLGNGETLTCMDLIFKKLSQKMIWKMIGGGFHLFYFVPIEKEYILLKGKQSNFSSCKEFI